MENFVFKWQNLLLGPPKIPPKGVKAHWGIEFVFFIVDRAFKSLLQDFLMLHLQQNYSLKRLCGCMVFQTLLPLTVNQNSLFTFGLLCGRYHMRVLIIGVLCTLKLIIEQRWWIELLGILSLLIKKNSWEFNS